MARSLTTEAVRDELRKAEAKAAALYAKAIEGRDAMIAEGVNPHEDRERFAQVDESFKAADQAKSDVLDLQAMLARSQQIDGYAPLPSGERPPIAGSPQASGAAPSRPAPRNLGERFTFSAEYEAFAKSGAFQSESAFLQAAARGLERPVNVLHRDELAATLWGPRFGATTITGGSATSAGPFIQNDLIPGMIDYLRETPRIASIVGQGTTDSDTVEYVSQSAPTNNAAFTAEGSASSEMVIPFATNTTSVQELPAWIPVTLRAMADAGQIRTIIENELVTNILQTLDTQVLSGNGSGANFTGITNTSNIGTVALGADTRLDAIHKAITTVRTAAGVVLDADYVVMHPNDWQDIRLEKDSNGQYLLGSAGFAGAMQVWGVPVVQTTLATSGTVVVGNFRRGATLWLRAGISVTSGLNAADFTTRQITLLAVMRAAFVAHRAGAFCTVTGF